jgi:hypothetical protein
VLISYLALDTNYSDRGFCGITQSLWENAEVVPCHAFHILFCDNELLVPIPLYRFCARKCNAVASLRKHPLSIFDFNSSGHSPRMGRVPKRRGKAVKSTGVQRSESGPGARLRCTYFCICALYRYRPIDQASFTLHLRVSLADLALRFLAGPPLLAEPKKFFIGPGTHCRRS